MPRPSITTYRDLHQFVGDMLRYLKATDPEFSVLQATRDLRRISPTLISLMVRRKRRITRDRAEELAKLLNLTPHEKQYLKDWTSRSSEKKHTINNQSMATLPPSQSPPIRRKASSIHLLSDWIHVFVKDAFDLPNIRKNPGEIYALLGGIASKIRIDQSIRFLVTHGYLRKTLDGSFIPESPLHSIDQKIPSDKVRKFHKALLQNAKDAIDQHSPDRRYANALVLSLNQSTYHKLLELIADQAESLQAFAENLNDGTMLYQVTINVSPTGGVNNENK